MIKVFTKLDGKLACWDVESEDHDLAIKLVRDELGIGHKSVILALVKY